MSILTAREAEFLASLRMSWRRYYFDEIARLLKEDQRTREAELPSNPVLKPAPSSG
jgi:hypothetical protein